MPLGPEAKEEENGEKISPPHPTLGSVMSSPSGVREEPRPKMVLL